MAEVTVVTNVPFAYVVYGNSRGYTHTEADQAGFAKINWSIFDGPLYVSVRKAGCAFPTTLTLTLPHGIQWGQTSERVLVNPISRTAIFYGLCEFRLPEVPIDEVIEEVEEFIEEVVEDVDEVVKAVCEYVTSAEPSVPSTLSAYFPISIRNAEWTCPETGEIENITGYAKVRIEGYEFDVPIRNGYGSPVNLGQSYEFRSILKSLGVSL